MSRRIPQRLIEGASPGSDGPCEPGSTTLIFSSAGQASMTALIRSSTNWSRSTFCGVGPGVGLPFLPDLLAWPFARAAWDIRASYALPFAASPRLDSLASSIWERRDRRSRTGVNCRSRFDCRDTVGARTPVYGKSSWSHSLQLLRPPERLVHARAVAYCSPPLSGSHSIAFARRCLSVVQARLPIETKHADRRAVLCLVRRKAFLRGTMTSETGLAKAAHCLCQPPFWHGRRGIPPIFVPGHTCARP